MPERDRRQIPDWAQKERAGDLTWIGENLHIFWPGAQQGFAQSGRGALVTDTTIPPVEHEKGFGHPLFYLPQTEIQKRKDEDSIRMVRKYDLSWEFVIVVLKSQDRESTYRVAVPSAKPSSVR